MYDTNTKNVKKGKSFFLIFLLAGLFFLLIFGGIIVAGKVKKNSLDSQTTSTRVEIRTHEDDEGSTLYSPTYYYEVNGQEYSCSSNSSSSINPGKSNKTVYYDSKNPSNCMTQYSDSTNNIFIIFLLLPIIFIAVAVINMRKISKRVALINELNQKGKLVKNLPYRLEDTGMAVNGVSIQRPVVDYVLPTGSQITLRGDPRHDKKVSDADGLVDLVIDEANPDNYFIDFEINRLSGNQPSDYYTSPNGQPAMPNPNLNPANPYQNMPDTYVNGVASTNPYPQQAPLPQQVMSQPTMPQQAMPQQPMPQQPYDPKQNPYNGQQ